MGEQLDDVLKSLDEETVESVPKQLREFAKRVEKENQELKQKVDTFETAQRESALNDFIKEKGLPDKAKSLIGDKDPEEWYKEFGELFTASSGEEETEGTEQAQANNALPDDHVQQMQGVQEVQPGNFEPVASDSEMNSKLDNLFSGDMSEKEVLAQLKAMGAM